jgi:hypothetical protein
MRWRFGKKRTAEGGGAGTAGLLRSGADIGNGEIQDERLFGLLHRLFEPLDEKLSGKNRWYAAKRQVGILYTGRPESRISHRRTGKLIQMFGLQTILAFEQFKLKHQNIRIRRKA